MCGVWWDWSSIIRWEIVANGFCYWWDDNDAKRRWITPYRSGKRQSNLDSGVYLAQLDRLEAVIQGKRKKNHIVFHHDNTQPHVEARTVQSINDKGWDLLLHPSCSPTEAPTDYQVNRSIKNWQMNKVENDLDGLVANLKAWIATKDRHFFARGIDLLPRKWESAIEADGDYSPEWWFDYAFSLFLRLFV